jgi:hypothetical protein
MWDHPGSGERWNSLLRQDNSTVILQLEEELFAIEVSLEMSIATSLGSLRFSAGDEDFGRGR